jgi:SAM-dependent methyltransferase
MSQIKLNNYFLRYLQRRTQDFNQSGFSLVDKISHEELVLDVGCGYNEFKGKIKNLVGIDPISKYADHQCTIEEFKTDQKFDVAICFDSLNYGVEETVLKQLECVIDLLKPNGRIYWRCNPGLHDDPNDDVLFIDIYHWTMDRNKELAQRYGFKVPVIETDNCNRFYAEWHKDFMAFLYPE